MTTFHGKMTRRAFLTLRVIQDSGKFDFNGLVKNVCFLVTKMEISQNLTNRKSSEQFSRIAYVMIYPEMHSLCLYMRLREIPHGGQIFSDPENLRKS